MGLKIIVAVVSPSTLLKRYFKTLCIHTDGHNQKLKPAHAYVRGVIKNTGPGLNSVWVSKWLAGFRHFDIRLVYFHHTDSTEAPNPDPLSADSTGDTALPDESGELAREGDGEHKADTTGTDDKDVESPPSPKKAKGDNINSSVVVEQNHCVTVAEL